VGLGLVASVVARCLAPALPGAMVGIESLIIWTSRLASLLTLLAATGLVAGIGRIGSVIVASPRAPLVARAVVVPLVGLSCLLLLLASFRPLEPLMALVLGIAASVVGSLSAQHCVKQRDKRAAALVLGLTAGSGLIHVLSRKLTQDASEAANLTVFRGAQLLETFASSLDLVALALTLVWLQRRAPRGRIVVPVLLGLGALGVVLALRGSLPGAGTPSVLVSRGLDRFAREQASLFPPALAYTQNTVTLLAAFGALLAGGGEIGLVLAACLAARSALDIPIPALLLELGALYLPFAHSSAPIRPAPSPPQAPVAADTSPP
jgi:hypothetical protein